MMKYFPNAVSNREGGVWKQESLASDMRALLWNLRALPWIVAGLVSEPESIALECDVFVFEFCGRLQNL